MAHRTARAGAALVAAEKSPRVQDLYRTYSDEALALGIFGAPSFVLDGVIYWGQDRLANLVPALTVGMGLIVAGLIGSVLVGLLSINDLAF